jgi:hypothetical protein
MVANGLEEATTRAAVPVVRAAEPINLGTVMRIRIVVVSEVGNLVPTP